MTPVSFTGHNQDVFFEWQQWTIISLEVMIWINLPTFKFRLENETNKLKSYRQVISSSWQS